MTTVQQLQVEHSNTHTSLMCGCSGCDDHVCSFGASAGHIRTKGLSEPQNMRPDGPKGWRLVEIAKLSMRDASVS